MTMARATSHAKAGGGGGKAPRRWPPKASDVSTQLTSRGVGL